jgi:hypothetical protein
MLAAWPMRRACNPRHRPSESRVPTPEQDQPHWRAPPALHPGQAERTASARAPLRAQRRAHRVRPVRSRKQGHARSCHPLSQLTRHNRLGLNAVGTVRIARGGATNHRAGQMRRAVADPSRSLGCGRRGLAERSSIGRSERDPRDREAGDLAGGADEPAIRTRERSLSIALLFAPSAGQAPYPRHQQARPRIRALSAGRCSMAAALAAWSNARAT